MKYKWIFVGIFSVLGLLAGFLVAILVAGFVTGLGWIFIFGDNPWPKWAGLLVAIPLIVSFGVTSGSIIFYGFKRGRDLDERQNGQEAQRQLRKWLGIVLLSLCFFAFLVYARYQAEVQARIQVEKQLQNNERFRGMAEYNSFFGNREEK